jgi:hypothetical protein
MADVAECRANIFRHIADMSSDKSMLRQNCRRQHPTNPTKAEPLTSQEKKRRVSALNQSIHTR